MERKNWLVIVNEEFTIFGGDNFVCENKATALNVASYISRVLYNVGKIERHIFVVNRRKVEVEPDAVNKQELENKVIYHYWVSYNKVLGLEMMLLFDGWSDNHKKIASRWLDKEG